MTNDTDDYSEWIGRTEIVDDDMSPATADAAAATFDETIGPFEAGAQLPPLWHWFYFLPKTTQATLGVDGHPQREPSGFMPPIPQPRRMFAGARLKWHHRLIVGRPARREAVIRKIVQKSGHSGALTFVTVGYQIFQEVAGAVPADALPSAPSASAAPHRELPGYDLCIEEEQDIVYREPGPPLSPPEPTELPPVLDGAWSQIVVPDTRLLFRFSALTFNAHRIHYDLPYAIDQEGYPGLVVHGPLTAMLLLQLVRRNSLRSVTAFSFRGVSPLFASFPIRLLASPSETGAELEAQGPDGKTAMTASTELA